VRENDSADERQKTKNQGRLKELYRVRGVRSSVGTELAADPARDERALGCCRGEDDGRGRAGRKAAE
jgi:hypothetical protein